MGNPVPFSIISVTRNDAWLLTKTTRSVFRQRYKDFEYIVVDGASDDGTMALVAFWKSLGLITKAISEPDAGVYNAMNKALSLATGKFVCFMNAGDIFADDHVLDRVHQLLGAQDIDGVLGWGALNDQIWASWAETEAFKLASLGYCHQALFVKRSLLQNYRFDERRIKTDSDTLQLSRLYRQGAQISIVPEVLAIRGGEKGLSADLERSKKSIVDTLTEEYAAVDEALAEQVIEFRRNCHEPEFMEELLLSADQPFRSHLGYMVLDTLFLRQSKRMQPDMVDRLYRSAVAAIGHAEPDSVDTTVRRLLLAQKRRNNQYSDQQERKEAHSEETRNFATEEHARLRKLRARVEISGAPTGDFVVSLTSFPARIGTLHFVIQSLVEQTIKPREIHLWLGEDEIPNRGWLPRALLEFESRGLVVHFCPRTHHNYDKFLHNSEINIGSPFVIVDDDVIYRPTSMEALVACHARHPGSAIANRCHLMAVDDQGTIGPYSDWEREVQLARPSLLGFPTGAGGVLYPVGFLSDPLVSDAAKILAHAPYADDIWLKACAIARGTRTMSTELSRYNGWYHRYTPSMRAGALHLTNVDLNLNDSQLERCGELLDIIRPGWRRELAGENAA